MIKYTSKGMIKQVKNEKFQQNTLFLETAETLESPDMFYLDTNNAPANLIYVLEKNGLFTYTGRIRPSGFCNYPICQLTEKGKALLKL